MGVEWGGGIIIETSYFFLRPHQMEMFGENEQMLVLWADAVIFRQTPAGFTFRTFFWLRFWS